MKKNRLELLGRLPTEELLAMVTRRRMNGQGVNWMTIRCLKRGLSRGALKDIEKILNRRLQGRSPDQYTPGETALLDELEAQLM
jgi:hypothetical protein